VIAHPRRRPIATKTKADSHPDRAVDCRCVTGENRLYITRIQLARAGVTSRKCRVATWTSFEPPPWFANQAPGLGTGISAGVGGITGVSAGAGGGGVTAEGVSGIGAAGVGVVGAGLAGTGGAASDGKGCAVGLGVVDGY
jgi:hypothetical protein